MRTEQIPHRGHGATRVSPHRLAATRPTCGQHHDATID